MKQPIKKNLRSLFVLFATFAMVLSTFGAVFLLNNSPDTYNNEAAYAYTLPAGFTGTVVEIANQLELTGTATVSGIRYKDGKVETEEIGGVDVPLTVSGINVRTAMGQTASPAPYYFVLTADFAATGTWSPITSLAAGNTFDGDGFTISNLTTATANAGLFTTVSGTVKNLTLANVNIGNNGTLANQGAVAGTAAAPAVIENVHVRGGIIKGGDPTGGLVGTINGTGAVKISRCSNTAQVIGAAFVGGIVGQVSSATAVVTVYACKYMGEGRTVAAGSDITSLTGNGCGVGGIVGRMTAGNLSIEYCYFHGGIHTLTAGPTTGKGIGGIFGKLEGGSIKIDGCASEIGTITTANAPTTGAIAPSSVAPGTSTFGTNPANVTNCYYFLNPSMGGGVTPITNILGHTGIGVTNTATDLTYLNLIFDINVKHLGLRIIYVPEPDLPWVNFTFSTGYLYKELKQVPDSSPAVYKTYFKFLDAGALGTEYEEFYKFDFTVTVPATHNIKEPTVTIVRKITNLTLSGEREEQVFPLQNQNANVWDYSIIIDDAEGDEYVAIDIVPVLNTFTVKSISEDSAFDIPEEKEAGFTYLSGFEYINPSSPDMADLVIDGLLINDTFTFTIDVDPGRQRVPPNVRAARFDPITGNPVSPDLILSPVDITGDVYTYELAIKQDSIGYNYEVFIETYETPCFIVLPTEGEWVNYSLDTPTGLDFVEHGGDYMFIVTLDRYYDKGTPKITLSILDGYDYNTGTYVDTGAPGGYTIQEQSRSGGTIVYRIFGVIDDLKIDFLVDELNTYEIDLHSSMEADEYGVVQLKDNDGILTDAFRVYFGGLPYDGSLPYDIGLPYDGAESVNAGTSFTFSIEMEPGWAPKVITLTNAAGKVLYTLTFGEGQVFPDEDEFLTYGRMRGTYVFTINPVASDIYIHVDAYCPVFMISLRALDGVEDVVMGPEFDEEEGGYWSVITDGYVEYRIGPDGEVAFTVYLAEGYKLTEPDVHFWNDERMFAFDDEDNLKEKMEEIGDGVWRYTVRHPDRHIFISITGIPDPSAYTVTFKDIDGDTIGTPQSVPHGTAATPETAPDLSSEGKSFAGWYTELNGEGTKVTDFTDITDDLTVFAHYTVNQYTYTFYDYDGTTVLKTLKAEYGTVITPPTEPTRTSTAQYHYAFKEWLGFTAGMELEGDISFTADYTPTLRSYTITWENWDGEELEVEVYKYGETPSYAGFAPTRPSDAKFSYSFSGWTPAIVEVVGNATYIAQFDAKTRYYTVTFKNIDGDDGTWTTPDLMYEQSITYGGTIPSKASTDTQNYIFTGWDPAFTSGTTTVSGDGMEFTAVFTPSTRYYTVTWLDGDGKTLQIEPYQYNDTPSYKGKTPTKTPTNTIKYAFNNTWSPAIEEVDDDVTYTAQFDEEIRTYTITFDEKTVTVKVNGIDAASGDTVYFGDIVTYTYTGAPAAEGKKQVWNNKGLSDAAGSEVVAGDVTISAAMANIEYTITFGGNVAAKVNGRDVKSGDTIYYGDRITYSYTGIPAEEGWHVVWYNTGLSGPSGRESAAGNVTLSYKIEVLRHEVTFVDGDGNIIEVQELPEGGMPTQPDEPAKASTPKYHYVFKGWDKTISKATSDTTYTAQFEEVLRKYTVTFVGAGKEVLSTEQVNYGAGAKEPDLPTRKWDIWYKYTFAGWDEIFDNITGNLTVTAQFDKKPWWPWILMGFLTGSLIVWSHWYVFVRKRKTEEEEEEGEKS